jgi:hypothetical protein
VKEGWDGPELTPAKIAITTKKVELRPSVPEIRPKLMETPCQGAASCCHYGKQYHDVARRFTNHSGL